MIDEASSGLHEFERILNSTGPNTKDNLLKFLSSARNGILETSEEINPELLLGFAYAAKINRAMFLLKHWSD
jgi:hypothetical protein